jgi:hypothetical protein
MCYFCHTLGNNPGAPPHRGEKCRDPRNSHSKKAKPPQASGHPSLSSFRSQSDSRFESRLSKPDLVSSVGDPHPGTPPLFFIQTECGRFVDCSLPQGVVLADHHAAGSQGQLFSMSATGVITDATTQRVLDCRDVRKGSPVALAAPSGSASQRWKISPDGSISLVDAALCLDVSSKGGMAALSPLIVWIPHGRSNQRFRIVSSDGEGGVG